MKYRIPEKYIDLARAKSKALINKSYRPWTEGSISQFCNTNCTHSILRTMEVRVGF